MVFITNLLLTIFLQFLCLLAWLSIVSFILYVTHSYLAAFIGYLVTSIILSTPMLVFPDIEILRYLILDFAYAMTTNSQAILYHHGLRNGHTFLLFQWTDYFQEEKLIKMTSSRI